MFSTLFTKEDDEYDPGMGKRVIEIGTATCDVRHLNNFVEDWGSEAIKDKRNLSQFKLLDKYKSIKFCFFGDGEITRSFDGLFCVIEDRLEWIKRFKELESGWRVFMRKASCIEDAGEDSDDDYMS